MVFGLASAGLTETAAAANPYGSQIIVAPNPAAIGSSVEVIARGLAPDTLYQVDVCGDLALNGSSDCDMADSLNGVTGKTGAFTLNLAISQPPAPCPCVVAAFSSGADQPVTASISVLGAPEAPPSGTAPGTTLEIQSLNLEGSWSWSELFGASPHRTLVLKVHNGTNTAITDSTLSLGIQRGSGSSSSVEEAPPLGTIAPGQTSIYRIPVTFPVLSIGSYHVVGRLGGASGFDRISVPATLAPWGLLAVGLLIVLALLWVFAIRIRRRLDARRRRQRARANERAPVGVGSEGSVTS